MRTLHLAHDDKFLPFVQSVFEEAFPGGNRWRVRGEPGSPPAHLRAGPGVATRGPSYWSGDEVAREAGDADLVIVHYMTPWAAEAVRRLPASVAVMWVGWGADFYGVIAPHMPPLLLPETAALTARLHEKPAFRTRWAGRARAVARRLGVVGAAAGATGPAEATPAAIGQIASRLDLVWFTPPELALVRRALPALRAENHRICYYSAERVFAAGPAEWSGPDILAGNSATPTNNHMELFRLLASCDLGDGRVVVPLSYGDTAYADAVEREGRRILGSRFLPLRRFMPPHEYAAALAGCGTVVMNHVRQQAATTIAMAAYKGARVYLRAESPLCRFYREMGLTVSLVEDDLGPGLDPFRPLPPDAREKNRRILAEYWSHETAVRQARRLADRVEDLHRVRPARSAR